MNIPDSVLKKAWIAGAKARWNHQRVRSKIPTSTATEVFEREPEANLAGTRAMLKVALAWKKTHNPASVKEKL